MKKRQDTQSATSVPVAGAAEADSRVRHYAITMGIRTACFLLMAFIQPVGWYTWVLAVGAIFLPYVAVVAANNPKAQPVDTVTSPDRVLEAPEPAPLPRTNETIVIHETPIVVHEKPREDDAS